MSERLRRDYETRVPLLEEIAKTLENETKAALSSMNHIDRIAYRVKKPQNFVEKATDRSNNPAYQAPLVEIEDQVAGRIIVFFLEDIDVVIERLRGTFNTVESTRRRPEKDEEFGYESHHMICIIPPHMKPPEWDRTADLPTTFELQVRTLFMHAWAEPQHDLAYKRTQDLERDVRRELYWVAASAWGADRALQRIWARLRARSGA